MKFNKWTVGLAAVGVVSLASAARGDEQMSQVQTALTQTTLSGYVDAAMQWNPGSDRNPSSISGDADSGVGNGNHVPSYAFAKDDGFSLNAVDIALDKPEDSSAWAAGYHVEMMYGANAVGVPLGSVGGEDVADGDASFASAATIRQAFIRLHTPIGGNGIDWEIGVFDNIIGYESNSDPNNPNYTRSYGYSIEPTTFTGILGTYKINDMLSLSAGIADNDGGLGSITPTLQGSTEYESEKAYMASATFTAPDSMGFMKGATFSFGWVHGQDAHANFVNDGLGNGVQDNLYFGATIPTPMNQLKLGVAFDYLFEDNTPAGEDVSKKNGDDIWTIGLYGTFQATDKLSFDARAEYVSDDSSFNQDDPEGDVVHLYSFDRNGDDFGEGGNFQGNAAEELTLTAQYNLWANVITRAEFRWDHVEHENFFGADRTSNSTDGDRFRGNDFLLALNVIYQF
jgi:hypothetical protein